MKRILVLLLLLVSSTVCRATSYQSELIGPITDESSQDTIFKLHQLTSEDSLTIFIDSRGGSTEAMLEVLSAMETAQGKVTAVKLAKAHSAAAMIFLNSPNRLCKSTTKMVVYGFQVDGMISGSLTKTLKDLLPLEVISQAVITKYLAVHLTKDELRRVRAGEDVFIRCTSHGVIPQSVLQKATTVPFILPIK